MRIKLLILLFISLNCSAQKNIISGTYQVVNKGFGIRYDRIIDNYGVYGYFNPLRYSAGVEYKFCPQYKKNPYFSAGLVYNREGKTPISFEVGVNNYVHKINIGFRLDIITHEAMFDIGYRF